MSLVSPAYRESERKYLIRHDDTGAVPDNFANTEPITIEQYYLNHATEDYELRLRRMAGQTYERFLATVKKGSPPDRLEMETEISPETYELWQADRQTEILSKQRRILAYSAGHWALDNFARFDFSLIEAEGEVPQPGYGTEVTDDTRFTNYELAQLNDLLNGYLPDSLARPAERSDLGQLQFLVEFIRRRSSGPTIVGIAGGTASGKTTLARNLTEDYVDEAVIISQDDYYYGVDKMRQMHGAGYEVNFDAPVSLNSTLLAEHIKSLRAGESIERPTYSMATSNPTDEIEVINPAKTPIIFVEGIHALDPQLGGLYDLTIFAEAPLATRVGRRLERDLVEGRTFSPEDNLRYLLEVAEPTYRPHADSQKAVAEVVLNT